MQRHSMLTYNKHRPMHISSLVLGCWTALLLLYLGGCSQQKDEGRRKQTVPVVVSTVEKRDVPLSLHVVGTVESTGTVSLQSRVDGQVVKVFVRDGDEVKVGQQLLQIDPVPFLLQVRMAQATLARDSAQLANAEAKAKRGADLQAIKYISAEENAQLQTDRDAAAATVAQDRAALDNAKLQLSYATIVAPIAGKIGHIAQQVGNTIRASGQTPLTTLNVLDTVDVTFSLPEQQLAPVRQAIATSKQPLKVVASALGQESNSLAGVLSFIDNTADPSTGTIQLRARFDNHSRVLWPGALVDIGLDLPSSGAALVIPDAALGENAQGQYVFVVGQDGTAQQRSVKVIRDAGGMALVTGVQEGEKVVTDGQSRLTPGSHVKVQPAKTSS
jgi:multidrug efflux system membrane fusion protein